MQPDGGALQGAGVQRRDDRRHVAEYLLRADARQERGTDQQRGAGTIRTGGRQMARSRQRAGAGGGSRSPCDQYDALHAGDVRPERADRNPHGVVFRRGIPAENR